MDPLGGVRSSMAQGKALTKGMKGKIKRAKGMKAKAAKINFPVVKYVLIFLLIGVLLGLSVFFPIHGYEGISRVKLVFSGMSVILLLLGMWHIGRMERKIEWVHPLRLGPELLFTIGIALILSLGIFLIFYFLPALFPDMLVGHGDFAAITAAAAIFFIIPFLVERVYKQSILVQPKIYRLWYYPKNYKEKQPTWNRDKLVYANLDFTMALKDPKQKRIEVRLPMEANFGEIIYLFINDFNQNKQPEDPIRDLRLESDSMGWLFSVPKRFLGIKVGKRYLDPELTVEDNDVQKQMDINFERTFKETSDNE